MTQGTTQAHSPDGRAARSARTRDAVVDALLALIEEGDLRPTARRVAERAGVSLRSVYVHFDDLEDLFAAAAARHFERLAPLLVAVPAHGPLPERIDALVAQRTPIHEAAAAVRRAAVLQEPSSQALAGVLELARAANRDDLARVLAPELAVHADPERLLDSLDVATEAATWEVLRRHHQRSVEDSAATVRTMLAALLGAP